jgi:hypothetical protein
MEGPTRDASAKPYLLDRDLPDVSVKVVHLGQRAADGKRHLPSIPFHDLVANAFPAACGADRE